MNIDILSKAISPCVKMLGLASSIAVFYFNLKLSHSTG